MMNERIKELAEQAGMKECALGYGMPENVLWGDSNIEKFAELLIHECATVLMTLGTSYDGSGSDYDYMTGMLDSASIIKEHFGVE
jgi:hypothetical protein